MSIKNIKTFDDLFDNNSNCEINLLDDIEITSNITLSNVTINGNNRYFKAPGLTNRIITFNNCIVNKLRFKDITNNNGTPIIVTGNNNEWDSVGNGFFDNDYIKGKYYLFDFSGCKIKLTNCKFRCHYNRTENPHYCTFNNSYEYCIYGLGGKDGIYNDYITKYKTYTWPNDTLDGIVNLNGSKDKHSDILKFHKCTFTNFAGINWLSNSNFGVDYGIKFRRDSSEDEFPIISATNCTFITHNNKIWYFKLKGYGNYKYNNTSSLPTVNDNKGNLIEISKKIKNGVQSADLTDDDCFDDDGNNYAAMYDIMCREEDGTLDSNSGFSPTNALPLSYLNDLLSNKQITINGTTHHLHGGDAILICSSYNQTSNNIRNIGLTLDSNIINVLPCNIAMEIAVHGIQKATTRDYIPLWGFDRYINNHKRSFINCNRSYVTFFAENDLHLHGITTSHISLTPKSTSNDQYNLTLTDVANQTNYASASNIFIQSYKNVTDWHGASCKGKFKDTSYTVLVSDIGYTTGVYITAHLLNQREYGTTYVTNTPINLGSITIPYNNYLYYNNLKKEKDGTLTQLKPEDSDYKKFNFTINSDLTFSNNCVVYPPLVDGKVCGLRIVSSADTIFDSYSQGMFICENSEGNVKDLKSLTLTAFADETTIISFKNYSLVSYDMNDTFTCYCYNSAFSTYNQANINASSDYTIVLDTNTYHRISIGPYGTYLLIDKFDENTKSYHKIAYFNNRQDDALRNVLLRPNSSGFDITPYGLYQHDQNNPDHKSFFKLILKHNNGVTREEDVQIYSYKTPQK